MAAATVTQKIEQVSRNERSLGGVANLIVTVIREEAWRERKIRFTAMVATLKHWTA